MAERYDFLEVDGRDVPDEMPPEVTRRYPPFTPEQSDHLAALIQSHPVVRIPRI